MKKNEKMTIEQKEKIGLANSNEKHGMYKNGLYSNNPKKCIDCGKIISPLSTRCKSCSKKGKLNPLEGKIPWNKDTKGIMKAWNKNIPMTQATKEKLSLAKTKIPKEIRTCICGCGETFKCRINSKRKYINNHNHTSVDNKNLISIKTKEAMKRSEIINKISKTWFKKGEHKSKNTEFKKGEHPSIKTEFTLERLKEMEKQGKFSIKPNKPETILINLLNVLFPNEYKYVGDFKFWIENFNPDFINCNGQKKIIEYFGNHWHTTPKRIERDIKRLDTYKKYGYNTLIIRGDEIKDIENIKNRITEFHNV